MPYVSSITRSVDAGTVEVSKRRRQVRAIWSSDEADAHRTAFVMGGIDTARFSANPVNLWEHGKSAERGTMPVANALEYGADRFKGKNVFIGTSRFWDDEFSDKLFDRYASGQLRGWSINVLPLEASPPTREERRARPDWADLDVVYRTTRLLEVSATSLPSNPSTLTLSVERSFAAAATPTAGARSAGCPARRRDVLGLLNRVNDLRRLAPRDNALTEAAERLAIACTEWDDDPLRRRTSWLAATMRLEQWGTSRAGMKGLPDLDRMSVEELEQEIKRLKLMKELCELMAKHEEAAKHKAAAEKMEREKAAMAAMAGGRG